MINLKKIKQEKCQPLPLFKKTCSCTILTTPYLIFQISPLQGRCLTFTTPSPQPIKKGADGPNYEKINFCLENLLLLYALCNAAVETSQHIFSGCHHTKALWNQLKLYCNEFIFMSDLTPQTGLFGSHDNNNDFITKKKHILLLSLCPLFFIKFLFFHQIIALQKL